MQAELSEEKALIVGLSSSQAAWQERAKQAEAELARAQEEMREVLLNLELRDKIAEASAANEVSVYFRLQSQFLKLKSISHLFACLILVVNKVRKLEWIES